MLQDSLRALSAVMESVPAIADVLSNGKIGPPATTRFTSVR